MAMIVFIIKYSSREMNGIWFKNIKMKVKKIFFEEFVLNASRETAGIYN